MTHVSPRVAMLSVHTSPLEQPGTGDAGGMNVYVTELSAALARRGADVEIFTRRTASTQPDVVEVSDGVVVRHVTAGPFEGLDKNDLPGQLCYFSAGVLRTEAARQAGWYDVVHSHYWLSGQAGWLAADRWGVPLVHAMHTTARVKNASLAPGDAPEPMGRVIGEEQVVQEAHALIANTPQEADDLVAEYHADPARVHVVTPGVDLGTFTPDGPGRDVERAALGLPLDRPVVLFAGRVQLLKAPDVLVRALGVLADRGDAVPLLVVLGGPSGRPTALRELQALAYQVGVEADVVFRDPVPRPELARWFRAVDVVAVPSRSESFGLVAVEAQACGTPVVAADVGGLRTAVSDGVSGVLVPGHDPHAWARTLHDLVRDDVRRAGLARGALAAAGRFSWDTAAEQTLEVYDLARRG
ncbi:D-inositol-3-phosphate glycosyltransferase [Sanguibacter suaedae]|uniref:D-inositol-3-phosphate glycosyltransferase n=1 Tax=Sanguibacter suaedae TaxID=2795737 RepID=A0A934I6I9_9MICO|nr:D-inositol-3-phosphate glycosyltransferase [Sanguibacter suaedae]MBI9116223.1 D-inositol-3-phosphate glycosyltransferase [Sanguibacter suaedae]